MSYARSPRAVCSTTIGTKLSARVVMECRPLRMSRSKPRTPIRRSEDSTGPFQDVCCESGLKVHELFESRTLVVHLSMREHPVHHLVLQCQTLHLAHRIRVLQIGAFHGRCIAVHTDRFVQACVRTG